MKLSGLAFIAGIALVGVAAPSSADVVVHRTVTTTHTEHHTGMRHMNHGKRRVCHTRWVHHHKVRKCTWQRW
jgi:hypothetical protein